MGCQTPFPQPEPRCSSNRASRSATGINAAVTHASPSQVFTCHQQWSVPPVLALGHASVRHTLKFLFPPWAMQTPQPLSRLKCRRLAMKFDIHELEPGTELKSQSYAANSLLFWMHTFALFFTPKQTFSSHADSEEIDRKRARVKNSEGGDVPQKYFVVTNNQLLRVKYLLVYSQKHRR